MNKHHLPGLNAIRFYAAFSVLVVHLGLTGSAEVLNVLALGGINAITLFFVLSGFLITHLLLQERTRLGHVDVGAFYRRRALRIIPLYYVAALVMLLIPNTNQMNDIQTAGVLLLLPQLVCAFAQQPMGIMAILWSIGVEEIFYAFWAPLVNRHGVVKPALIAIIVCVLIGLPFAMDWHQSGVDKLIRMMRFEAMAIGALMAWMVHTKHRLLRWFYHPAIQALAWMSFLVTAIYEPEATRVWYDVAFEAVAAVIIVNIATNPKTIVRLEHPVLSSLGNVTYGMYLWHQLIIFFAFAAVGEDVIASSLVNAGALIVVTVIAAYASYYFIEKPFLRLKNRWRPLTAAAPIHAT